MSPAAVIIVLNGAVVASVPPARLLFGAVMAPLAPVVTRFTERAVVAGDTITVVRGGRTCVLRIGSAVLACDGTARSLPVVPFAQAGTPFVPVAELARAFGGTAAYDARSGVLELDLPPQTLVVTPAPFDPNAPQATPTTVFTPSPRPATPQPLDSGSPKPRRTAIPAIPSRAVGN